MITQDEEHFTVDVKVVIKIDRHVPRASNRDVSLHPHTDLSAALAWINRQHGWPDGTVPLDTPYECITDEHRDASASIRRAFVRMIRVRFDRRGKIVSFEDAKEPQP